MTKFILALLLLPSLAFAQQMTLQRHQRVRLRDLDAQGRDVIVAGWASSDSTVAHVINSANPDLHGTLIGRDVGSATITATANDGSQQSTDVKVEEAGPPLGKATQPTNFGNRASMPGISVVPSPTPVPPPPASK